MTKNMPQNRRTNYQRLRKVGYTAKEANRFKDMTQERIEMLIEAKQDHYQDIEKILQMPKGVIVNDKGGKV